MPLYEYTCKKCGASYEALVAGHGAKAPCPKCGSKEVEKQFSTFSASVSSNAAMPACAGGACSPSHCASGACPFSQG